ncbi:hypothetical protein ECTW00353_1697, partial [Escherichia coli TW00353]
QFPPAVPVPHKMPSPTAAR